MTVLVQVRNLAHDQPELVTQAQEKALRLRTDLVRVFAASYKPAI